MEKNLDFEIYFNNGDLLNLDPNLRKVLHSRILKLDSTKSKLSYGIMGTALSNSAKFQESIFPLKKAAVINPTYSKIQIRLTESLLKLGEINGGLTPNKPKKKKKILKRNFCFFLIGFCLLFFI